MASPLLNTILVFAILIIGSSWAFAYLQPGAELKMIIDVSLGAIRFFGMLIAVFMGTRLIPDEMEKRTIHTILAKPVSRSTIFVWQIFGRHCHDFGQCPLNGPCLCHCVRHKSPQFKNLAEGAMSMEFMFSNILKLFYWHSLNCLC